MWACFAAKGRQRGKKVASPFTVHEKSFPGPVAWTSLEAFIKIGRRVTDWTTVETKTMMRCFCRRAAKREFTTMINTDIFTSYI